MLVDSPWNIDMDKQKKIKYEKRGLAMFCNLGLQLRCVLICSGF